MLSSRVVCRGDFQNNIAEFEMTIDLLDNLRCSLSGICALADLCSTRKCVVLYTRSVVGCMRRSRMAHSTTCIAHNTFSHTIHILSSTVTWQCCCSPQAFRHYVDLEGKVALDCSHKRAWVRFLATIHAMS